MSDIELEAIVLYLRWLIAKSQNGNEEINNIMNNLRHHFIYKGFIKS